jgi:hypothetical protein
MIQLHDFVAILFIAFIIFMVILFIGSIIASAIDEECEEYGMLDIPNEDIYPLW